MGFIFGARFITTAVLLAIVSHSTAIPFPGVENEIIVPRQDGPQYRVCYPLTADQVQTLPGWKKLEAHAIERWGEGFEVNVNPDRYPDRGAEVCIGDAKVSASFAEEPVCTRSGTEALSRVSGTNGDITYIEEIGSVRSMEWSVTETTAVAASVGFSATFGIPGIGEAGVETSLSVGLTNEIGSSDKVENSNKKAMNFKFSNPDGKVCKMNVNVEDCQAMAKARVPIVATGNVWFWYKSKRFDNHKVIDTDHFHWTAVMEDVLTEEERSSYISVTGTVKSQSTFEFETNCTSVNPPAPPVPPVIPPPPSTTSVSSSEDPPATSPTAPVTSSQVPPVTTSSNTAPPATTSSNTAPPATTSSNTAPPATTSGYPVPPVKPCNSNGILGKWMCGH